MGRCAVDAVMLKLSAVVHEVTSIHTWKAVFFACNLRVGAESLRYLSLHDNQYLRYFKGHRDKVVSLAMVCSSDEFYLMCPVGQFVTNQWPPVPQG